MVIFRRNKLQTGVYFITVALRNRKTSTLIDYIDLLGKCMRQVKAENCYEAKAIVVLPEHLHINWRYSSFHRYVKKGILTKDWSSSEIEEMSWSGLTC